MGQIIYIYIYKYKSSPQCKQYFKQQNENKNHIHLFIEMAALWLSNINFSVLLFTNILWKNKPWDF